MKCLNGDKIIYSSYWRTYSRILKPFGEGDNPHEQVEVDLTAINPQFNQEWYAINKINIRKHLTKFKPTDLLNQGDKILDELPEDILKSMLSHLSANSIYRLLNEDFINNIDWDKYNQISNGGASFDLISKTKAELPKLPGINKEDWTSYKDNSLDIFLNEEYKEIKSILGNNLISVTSEDSSQHSEFVSYLGALAKSTGTVINSLVGISAGTPYQFVHNGELAVAIINYAVDIIILSNSNK